MLLLAPWWLVWLLAGAGAAVAAGGDVSAVDRTYELNIHEKVIEKPNYRASASVRCRGTVRSDGRREEVVEMSAGTAVHVRNARIVLRRVQGKAFLAGERPSPRRLPDAPGGTGEGK